MSNINSPESTLEYAVLKLKRPCIALRTFSNYANACPAEGMEPASLASQIVTSSLNQVVNKKNS